MQASRKVKLIFNPHADGGRGWRIASSLQAVIERHGGAEWTATEFPTHATQLALEAARQGFQVVVAIGGDGTVHEVVNGLMKASPTHWPRGPSPARFCGITTPHTWNCASIRRAPPKTY